MNVIGLVVFCLGLAFACPNYACGKPCTDLTGVWRNQLGSNMSIVHLSNDHFRITGQYNTSVESSRGAAAISSPIAGMVKPVDGGSLVALNVLYNHGASLASWVGQCIVCDGEEKIFTTWVLRALMPPAQQWMTTRINQDTFWRVEDLSERFSLEETTKVKSMHREILGVWNSVSGDAFNITDVSNEGNFEGAYLTPEKKFGFSIGIFGIADGNQSYTALGFSAAGPYKIKGWTGHIYNPQDTNKIMETSWLEHTFTDCCKTPREFINYGMDNYTQPQGYPFPASPC